MLMCKCKTKIQFEIDGGGLYSQETLEENNCGGFSDCLSCLEIDDALEDGIYTADMLCEVYQSKGWEGTEYDGSSIVENIIKLEFHRKELLNYGKNTINPRTNTKSN